MATRTLALLATAVLALTACSNHPPSKGPIDFPVQPVSTDSSDTGQAPLATDSAVTYKLASNGTKALITYTDEGGSIEQANDATLPWVKTVNDPGMMASISGQDTDGTEITCLIVDSAGNVLSGHTATGPYAIVTCSH